VSYFIIFNYGERFSLFCFPLLSIGHIVPHQEMIKEQEDDGARKGEKV
jgi:hypothetical protein